MMGVLFEGDLLPCPFCGASAACQHGADEDGEYVCAACSGCGIESGRYSAPFDEAVSQAMAEWNRRVPANQATRSEAEVKAEALEELAADAEAGRLYLPNWTPSDLRDRAAALRAKEAAE